MPQLVCLVIFDPSKVDDVVRGWVEAGVRGMTLIESSGLAHHLGSRGPRDDLPLFPSLRNLLEAVEHHSRLMFSVVPDGFDIDRLIAATEAAVGRLDDPNTGILFVLPVSRAAGL
jgi:hypothetical protein